MENTIQSDLIRGHINTIILKALFDGVRYGSDFVREIEQKSSGQYKLKQPTLYSCLKRLEIQGFIRSYWGAKSNGGRRKYFTLTDMGRELFLKNQSEWEYSRTVIDKLISDKEVDLRTASSLPYDEEISEEEEIPEDFDAETPALTESETASTDVQNTENETPVSSENTVSERADTYEDATKSQNNEVTKRQIEYSDTTAIMNELFRRQVQAEADASYAEKLVAEKYVSDRSDTGVSSDRYFTDFFELAETSLSDENSASEPAAEPQNEAEQPTQAQTPSSAPVFLDYHTSSVVPHPENAIIEREYRNIIGEFLNPSFVEHSPQTQQRQEETPPADSVSENDVVNEESEDAADETFTEKARENEYEQDTSEETYTSDADVNRKLNRLTGEVREMGDNVVIRTHNNASSKEYRNAYYYYSNKLMLVHYGILFGIMMLEILFSAVFVSLLLHEGRSTDKWFYIVAGVLAALFPIAAFIKNVTAPTKRKRVNFSLKNSLLYRFIVMAQCFLIIYCLNIIAGMPLSFSGEYLTTVLMPALLCTNFPVSALLFNALFKSGRFSVEQ